MGLTIFASSLSVLNPKWGIFSRFCGLASGVSYFLGFATPPFLRQAWQEPELRAFLGQAATLPRLPTTAIIQALQHGVAASVGAPRAAIGIWHEDTNSLSFDLNGEVLDVPVRDDEPVGRSLLSQQPFFVPNLRWDMPAYSHLSRADRSTAILAAPITAGQKRLGVLTVYADRAPIFARDDLALVQLLADQAAVILESRALIDEAARVQAREEATRLKDDFLSAAAHDLKTPLTTLVGRTQLLERRALRAPDAPADLASIRAVLAEAQRLKTFVLELLDATRAERGHLVGRREEVDLRTLIEETVRRRDGGSHTIVVDTNGPVVGAYDPNRICQLLENLLENAMKYSPE
ncbi:MAG TPA: GAF domain-containing protein, partial [Herpetosiphonaceae bacterium]|nr:GAF domain-containing protein [Herpetosiphonaceae bacterium]